MTDKETYKNLTSIDIDEQSMIQDERAVGYKGEFLVLSELLHNIQGNCKILINLNIPINNTTTEIDLVMIHERGFFVFEVKHYKGTIYGKSTDKNWTQYFRTQSNITFPNPIKQNGHHIKAIKNLFPDSPVRSVVVFSNHEVKLNVENDISGVAVCTLNNLINSINRQILSMDKYYTPEQIDDIFNQLTAFSPIREKNVTYNDTELTFYDYLQQLQKDAETRETSYEIKSRNLEEKEIHIEKASKIKTIISLLIASISVVACIAIVFSSYSSFENMYVNKVKEFEKTYQRIDEIDNEAINNAKGIIKVSDVKLNKTSDLKDTVNFSCKLTNIAEKYGIALNKNSTYIVLTKDGQTLEYPIFSNSFRYNGYTHKLNPKGNYSHYYCNLVGTFTQISSADNIEYIKITNVTVTSFGNNGITNTVSEGVHIELYKNN